VDQTIEVPLTGCPQCGGGLTDVEVCEQFIEEIPAVQPIVTKLTTYVGCCPECGEVRSTHPLQTSTATGAAGTHLGPRAQAVAVSLVHQSGMTFRKACGVLRDLWGLSLTPGGLSQLLQRVSERVQGWWEEIADRIRRSTAVNADETSWYVGEPGWWLWDFTTPDAVLYRVEKSRGSDVVLDTLGPDYGGMLVSDCLATYGPIECRKHKCIAHHLRALAEQQQALEKRGIESMYLKWWKIHFQDVIATWKARSEMSEVDYALKVLQLKRGATRLLGRSPPEPEEIHFRNRLERVREHLHGCLAEPAAEPTNNRAERDLRPAVISRKLSCGNKTETGKRTWEVLRSVTTTAVKQQLDLLDELPTYLRLQTQLPPVGR
jgi:transposase